jgi:cell division protein FtsI (penicillin-binding protein 3)
MMNGTAESPRRTDRPRSRIQLRLVVFGLLSTLWIGAVVLRLGYLHVLAAGGLRELAERQHEDRMKLDPARGSIFDRNGKALAVSIDVESVYAAPQAVSSAEDAAPRLARCLGLAAAAVRAQLESPRAFVWIERKVDPAASDCVRQLNLPGVNLLPESARFYPKRTTAAHVLGWVGMDNQGMSGVEYAFDEQIRGQPGQQIILTDARRRRAWSRIERTSVPGKSIYLSLDETLQHIAQLEIERAVGETRSRAGVALLMRPGTGEILAMAGAPGFSPNVYNKAAPEHWRNRSVTDAYEPGSTFKLIVAAAALEEQAVTEDERIDCGRGSIRVSDRVILDHRSFDVLPFADVIAYSSNVGIIRIGQRLGPERLYRFARAFGFGEPTGVGLSAESRGILRDGAHWTPTTLASVSFGQEIAATPLQTLSAVNVIAARGYWMRPQLVREIRSPDGTRLEGFYPQPVRRVLSEETASRLTRLMEGVVERGSGKRAAIPGYRVAGKTGTAQKAVPGGGYSATDYVASFVGFVPAEAPQLTGLVLLDSPAGDHSGALAAAYFSRMIERSLLYLGVPARASEKTVRLAARWPALEPLELSVPSPSLSGSSETVARVAYTWGLDSFARLRRMPALSGLPARDAVARAMASGLVPQLSGSGVVIEQYPPEGTPIETGSRCRLTLRSRPSLDEPHAPARPSTAVP